MALAWAGPLNLLHGKWLEGLAIIIILASYREIFLWSFIALPHACALIISLSSTGSLDSEESDPRRKLSSAIPTRPICLFIQTELCEKKTLRDWLTDDNAERPRKQVLNFSKQVNFYRYMYSIELAMLPTVKAKLLQIAIIYSVKHVLSFIFVCMCIN